MLGAQKSNAQPSPPSSDKNKEDGMRHFLPANKTHALNNIEKANQKLRHNNLADMLVHGGQGLGTHYYSYTKDKEKLIGWRILFSHWLSKHYIPKEQGELTGYI